MNPSTPLAPPVFAGIDVAKDGLDLCVVPVGLVDHVANTAAGIRKLVKTLRRLPLGRVVLEPSGGYEQAVLAALAAAGLPVRRVNAAQIRAWAFAKGQRAKSDRLDAQVLAGFATQDDGPLYTPPSAAEQRLQALVDRRHQLVEQITAERQRRQQSTLPAVRQSIDAVLKVLRKEQAAIERALRETVQADATLTRRFAQLVSVPGIGPVVAWTLLADLPELATLDPKALAALAGLAPYARESGAWKGKRFIAGGRPSVRRAFYHAGFSGYQHNPVLQPLYARLVAKGKEHKVAVIACAHKVLRICHALLRDGTTGTPPASLGAAAA